MNRRRAFRYLMIVVPTAAGLAVMLPIACDRVVGNRSLYLAGTVVDELGRPLDDVSVSAEAIRENRFPPPMPFDSRLGVRWSESTTTDAQGSFSLGATGTSLSVTNIRKNGYLLPRDTPFAVVRTRGVAPATGPTLIRMWRRRGLFKVSQEATTWWVPRDEPLAVKLGRQEAVDLYVRFDSPHGKQWTVTLEPVGGGTQDATDGFFFLAPTDGYQATRSFTLSPARSWAGPIYLTCHDKQVFAVAIFGMSGIDSGAAQFHLNYRANRSGIPNLEPEFLANFEP